MSKTYRKKNAPFLPIFVNLFLFRHINFSLQCVTWHWYFQYLATNGHLKVYPNTVLFFLENLTVVNMYIHWRLFTFILVAMLSSKETQYLENIWSDPMHPAAFSRPEKLFKFAKKYGQFKMGLSAIKRFLSSLKAYSLHKWCKENLSEALSS